MLYRSAAQPCATPTFKHIYGGKLARALKAGALLAHDLATGAVAIRLSRKQAIALTHANATYETGPRPAALQERAAYTIREFCDAHRISKSTYYQPSQTRSRPRRGARAGPGDHHDGSGCTLEKGSREGDFAAPNRTAIGKIIKLEYAGAVHLDAVVDLLSPDS